MPLAHKPVMLRDSDYNTSSYCSVCGQENLDSDCPGEYVLTAKEQKHVDDAFAADMKKIFENDYCDDVLMERYKWISNTS